MDERELKAFVTIAQAGRMDIAAKMLGYSQPAISYQIKRLESTLGQRLFIRTHTGVSLTREGERILPSARAVLLLFTAIKEASAPAHLPSAAPTSLSG